ncbi:MAG TPA: hypothetical protein VK997_05150 [Deferrisomatales bacterium]|nr:hypothetical protein [Deferrisomatales bacterium]
MKCPKCNYSSFDYLETCKRCGTDLRDARSLLQIISVSPEDQAPAAPSMEMLDEEPLDEVAQEAESSFGDMRPLDEDEEILDGLDFDGSFDDLVEPTSYADQEPLVERTSYADSAADAARDPVPTLDEENDGLLDLDFGDLFEEKK